MSVPDKDYFDARFDALAGLIAYQRVATDRHEEALYGTSRSPGLFSRVTRIESFGKGFMALVAVVGVVAAVAGLFA